MSNQWTRFTPESMSVLSHAQREAITLQHNHLGTVHLILGVLGEGTSAAAKLLQSAGMRYEETLKIVAVLLKEPRAANPAGDKHWHVSQDVAKVAQHVQEMVDRLGHNEVRPEHILLGVLEQRSTEVVVLIEQVGVSEEALFSSLTDLLTAS